MPIVQGSAMWSLQRVFNNPRSSTAPQAKEVRPVSSFHVSSFWKSSNTSNLFLRRLSSAPCPSPKRSVSAPHDIPLKSTTNPDTANSHKSSARRERAPHENSISKSLSVPHTFTLKPNSLKLSADSNHKSSLNTSTSDNILASPQSDIYLSQSSSSPNFLTLDSPSPKTSLVKNALNIQETSPSDVTVFSGSKILLSKLSSPQLGSKKLSVQISAHNTSHVSLSSSPITSSTSPLKSTASQHTGSKHSPHNISPANSPLKSPPPLHSSRRTSIQGEQLPVNPSPPWSELVAARRRLLAVEGRRRALCALEMRVQQVHCVFIQAELRVSRQREGMTKLVEAAGRAEVQATVHGQRIRRALRHHKPRLLACALCVPWPTKPERRGGQHPRHPCCALFQGRIQVLRGCVGSEELGTRD